MSRIPLDDARADELAECEAQLRVAKVDLAISKGQVEESNLAISQLRRSLSSALEQLSHVQQAAEDKLLRRPAVRAIAPTERERTRRAQADSLLERNRCLIGLLTAQLAGFDEAELSDIPDMRSSSALPDGLARFGLDDEGSSSDEDEPEARDGAILASAGHRPMASAPSFFGGGLGGIFSSKRTRAGTAAAASADVAPLIETTTRRARGASEVQIDVTAAAALSSESHAPSLPCLAPDGLPVTRLESLAASVVAAVSSQQAGDRPLPLSVSLLAKLDGTQRTLRRVLEAPRPGGAVDALTWSPALSRVFSFLTHQEVAVASSACRAWRSVPLGTDRLYRSLARTGAVSPSLRGGLWAAVAESAPSQSFSRLPPPIEMRFELPSPLGEANDGWVGPLQSSGDFKIKTVLAAISQGESAALATVLYGDIAGDCTGEPHPQARVSFNKYLTAAAATANASDAVASLRARCTLVASCRVDAGKLLTGIRDAADRGDAMAPEQSEAYVAACDAIRAAEEAVVGAVQTAFDATRLAWQTISAADAHALLELETALVPAPAHLRPRATGTCFSISQFEASCSEVASFCLRATESSAAVPLPLQPTSAVSIYSLGMPPHSTGAAVYHAGGGLLELSGTTHLVLPRLPFESQHQLIEADARRSFGEIERVLQPFAGDSETIEGSGAPVEASTVFPSSLLGSGSGAVTQATLGVCRFRLACVLLAWAAYDRHVSYVQGQHFIASLSLRHLYPHQSWRLLGALMYSPRHDLARVFAPGLEGLTERLDQLDALLAVFAPRLSAHLARLGIPPASYATGWLMTCFTSSDAFPPALSGPLFGSFLLHGWKAVMRAALVLLTALEPDLLQADFGTAMQYLHTVPSHRLPASATALLRRSQRFKVSDRLLRSLLPARPDPVPPAAAAVAGILPPESPVALPYGSASSPAVQGETFAFSQFTMETEAAASGPESCVVEPGPGAGMDPSVPVPVGTSS